MMDKDFVVRILNQTAKITTRWRHFIRSSGSLSFWIPRVDEAGRKVRAAVSEGAFLTFERRNPSDPSRFERVITYLCERTKGSLETLLSGSVILRKPTASTRDHPERKLASLGLLISSIAHEINNPNNSISFNIPILRDYLQKFNPFLTITRINTRIVNC